MVVTKPFRDVCTPEALTTQLCLASVSVPLLAFESLSVSRFKELGGSQQFVGSVYAAEEVLGVLSIMCAPLFIPRLTAPVVVVLAALVNAACLYAMGSATNVTHVALAHVVHVLATKPVVIANSVWMSTSVVNSNLPSMFAIEKVLGTGTRVLLSRVITDALRHDYTLSDVFPACAYLLLGTASACAVVVASGRAYHTVEPVAAAAAGSSDSNLGASSTGKEFVVGAQLDKQKAKTE